MDKITWQQASALLSILMLSVGTVTYTDLFGVLFQLKGIDANYTGDIICDYECKSYIDIETSYWRICFAGYDDTKYENETLFKKVSRSRTLHVNLDKTSNIITTQRLLQNGSYELCDIEVEWNVPTYGNNWRSIKDGDCWDRKKINRIELVGHKDENDTIKWSFGLDGYVDIDPLWEADEKNETIINDTNITIFSDKILLDNPYNLNLSDDNIESYLNISNNICYSETDDMIISVENCNQYYTDDTDNLVYKVKLVNKKDEFSFYTFMVSSGDNIDSSYIDKKLVSYVDKDVIGTTKDTFYELNPFIFKPNETIHFNYTIYPRDTSGKFNFIGYNSYKSLKSSIKDKQYIFLDPTWEDAKVSYWNADTDGSFPDSWGTHTGTIQGATFNSSAYIDGGYNCVTDDNINISISDDWDGGVDNAFTIMMWVYANQWGVAHTFASNFQYIGGGASKGFTLNIAPSYVRFRIADVDTCRYTTDISGGWHHIVGTYDGTNARLYVDADLKDTDAVTLVTSSSNPLSLCAWENSVGGKGEYFDGTIDEIAFFDKALSITEIQDIYDNGLYRDSINPTYSENSTNSTDINTDILHSLKWTDDTNLTAGGYTFYYYNGTNLTQSTISDDKETGTQNFYGQLSEGFEYFDGFEINFSHNIIDALTNGNPFSNTDDWTRDSGGTPSSPTGPSIGSDSSTWYIFVETSSGSCYTSGEDAVAWKSEEINFDDGSNDQIEFDYHMYGTTIGKLSLEENSTGSWVELWSRTGQQSTSGTDWKTDTVDLSSLSGGGFLRFWYECAGNYYGDAALDGINISSSQSVGTDENKTAVDYLNVISETLYEDINNITVTTYISEYNTSGSIETGNINITIWLEAYNGSDWIDEGDFSADSTGNFSITITTYSILNNWETVANRDIRISARYVDYNTSGIYDTINWTGVWVEINSEREFVPDSFVEFSDSNCDNETVCWSNITKSSPSTLGALIKWKVYANDTIGNLNESEVFEYILTGEDSVAPTYSQNSTNSTEAGSYVLHILKLEDETALDVYIFSFDNGTGSLTNDSLVDISGTINWSNVTKGINHTVGSTIRWQVFVNDTSDNWNETVIFEYVTTSEAVDTCSCPASGTNWGWDLSDNCTISANCDIYTGKVYILNTNAGIWTINAIITASGDSTLNGTSGQYINGTGHLNLTVG